MAEFTREQKQKIGEYLVNQRGVNQGCPRCGSWQFHVLPGYVVLAIDADPEARPPERSFQTIGMNCDQCGYVVLHGLLTDDPLDLED